MVLKNCEPELSYILAKLFNKCLRESCFSDCWKVSSVVPVFKNVGERSAAKNYRSVSLLSVVSKVFEKLVNNRIVDHLEKCGLDFNAGKTQLVSFDRSKNPGAIDVKMDGSVLEEKTSFKMLGLTFSSKLYWGSYIVSIAKTASKKIGALICPMKFLSPEAALYLYSLPYGHVWNTALMSGLVLLVATWNCWISYRNGYAGLLVLHLLPFLTLSSSSKCSQLKSFL